MASGSAGPKHYCFDEESNRVLVPPEKDVFVVRDQLPKLPHLLCRNNEVCVLASSSVNEGESGESGKSGESGELSVDETDGVEGFPHSPGAKE
jgi:hypothetical protein